jgi:hypothetical protein
VPVTVKTRKYFGVYPNDEDKFAGEYIAGKNGDGSDFFVRQFLGLAHPVKPF